MSTKTLALAPAPSPVACGGPIAPRYSPYYALSPPSEGAHSPTDSLPNDAASPDSTYQPGTPSGPLTPGVGPSAFCTPAMNGPLGNSYVVPPRPKPGRKPATDDPPSKRKQQNREAQRAFRQRKTQKMEETNRELQRAIEARTKETDEHKRELSQLHTVIAEERARSAELEKKVDQLVRDYSGQQQLLGLKDETIVDLKRELDFYRQQRQPPQNQLTPPQLREEPPAALGNPSSEARVEIKASISSAPSASQQPTISSITLPPPVRSKKSVVDGCGKCTDTGECPCVDDLMDFSPSARPAPASSSLTQVLQRSAASSRDVHMSDTPSTPNFEEYEIDFTSLAKPKQPANPSARLSTMEPSCKPGTCDDCMKDPLQKRFCETLARERPFATNNSAIARNMASVVNRSNTLPSIEGAEPPAKRPRLETQRSIDCAQAYRRYFQKSHLPLDSEHPQWMTELVTLPPSQKQMDRLTRLSGPSSRGDGGDKRHMSAYELDMASVLNVLKKADTRHDSPTLERRDADQGPSSRVGGES
ncbi:hypothetical protein K490DRAFT_68536 [Saccharata proteae CBS 121410]|uniref:BZIP domain-containing protein n=1 Tax=Saccharata proteae CBS 121410 TaxID=1314787 RepID=A0A9P4LW07_9PEZI|nr:hypothetical protein K490DRAFT_68536 [Saccharata proteae CBS 121410]